MVFLRNVAALLAGVVTAGLVIGTTEAIAHSRLGGSSLFLAVALGYGLGTFVGTLVVSRLSGARWPSLTLPAILAALVVLNLFAIDHPIWFLPAAAATMALGFWAAEAFSRTQASRDG